MKLASIAAIFLLAQAFVGFIDVSPISSASRTVKVDSTTTTATPFIAFIHASVGPVNTFQSLQFTISPKPGSVTRAISATYTRNYLLSRGYLNTQTGEMTVPVFGLYANYSNTVTLAAFFANGSSLQNTVTITTPDWTDTCGVYKTPTVIQARTNSRDLSYDYMLVKNLCGSESPVIVDTDGAVRWVGPTGYAGPSSMFFANSIYVASGANPSPGINRIDLDGTITPIHDYSNIGVTSTNHHNYDPGKEGMLIEVNTTQWIESVILEVDGLGNILHTWNLADIISAAMIAGGDDPNQFVQSGQDWFHMNAATYRASDNSLIVSSRENFVIALDYESGAIKWILGDPTKQWHQFASLRQYELALGQDTLPPIGQHAVSITKDDNLLLFDDGLQSFNHTPPGASRSYSAPRKYHIDLQTRTAIEIWDYPNGQSLFSQVCSSVYEDAPSNYLIDYADIVNFGSNQYAELVGLEPSGAKVFDYRYANSGCSTAWNAIPIHLERMTFTAVPPIRATSRKIHPAADTFDVDLPLSAAPGIESRSGDYNVVVRFGTPVTVSGASVTPGNGGTATVVGPPTINGNEVAVHLTNVSNAQTLTVNLNGVNDGVNSDNVPISMSVLIGDINADKLVNSGDISATKAQSGNVVTGGNFRADNNGDGAINSGDISMVKSKSGTGLP